MIVEVFEILEKGQEPSEGFNVGRVMPDGVKIAKANLKEHPNAKGLTNDEVKKFINDNYPQPDIELWTLKP